jgi:hypothetical protein
METRVARWWNGSFGRLNRRDIELHVTQRWRVVIREGGAEGSERTWEFDTEDDARTMVRRCMETGGTKWREI